MRLNRPTIKWAVLGFVFVLSHAAWFLHFVGDSIGDGHRTSELRATRVYNAQLEAIYPLVAQGNPSRAALVQAMTLDGTVQVHNEGPTFAQAGPMMILFTPDGTFLGVQGIELPRRTSSNIDHVAATAVPLQSLSYAIYSLHVYFGDSKLIAEGKRVYSAADIRIVPGLPPVVKDWRKTL